jgi:sugar phosphate permease
MSAAHPAPTGGDVAVERIPRRAWLMLAIGVAAQATTTAFVSAPALLIPLLHVERHLPLAQAGLVAAAPTFGVMLTLIAWGGLADRYGERWVIVGGLALTAVAAFVCTAPLGLGALSVVLLLGGMAAASANAASGRVVVGWFPKVRRGLAMGIRQMAQPLGVTLAAVTVPPLGATGGVGAAILLPAVLVTAVAVAASIGIVDPPRPPRVVSDATPNPYLSSGFLWRVHLVSALLVVPQFTLSIFGLVWLVTELRWPLLAAGVLVGASQFVGALGRILVGVGSDRVGSRVRPLRWTAFAAVAVMVLLAAASAWQAAAAAAVLFVIATTVSVADNGLGFTSVAESAGPAWAGRALGAQNTGQYLAAAAVGPLVGGLITLVGYPLAFLTVAVAPAVAVPLVPPAGAERDRL